MSWPLVKLGEVCDVAMGQAPSGTSYNEKGKGNPLIAGAGDFGIDSPAPKKFTTAPTRLSEIGDIILCIRATIGDLNLSDKIYCLGRGVAGMRAKDSLLDQRYLWNFLAANTRELTALGTGSTFKQIGRGHIENFKIPLPPLAEQKRIAAILDMADAIARKRQKAIALTDTILKSVFLDMFGDPVTNPMGWEVGTINDCLKDIPGGWSAKGDSRPAKSDEVGVLKISSVTSGRFKPHENKVVYQIPVSKKLLIPLKGDLLFSRANTRELVAATCIVEETANNVFLPDKLWILRTENRIATGSYIKFTLSHPEYRRRLCEQATGTSGSMLNISKSKLLNHPIVIPPIELQNNFASFWWRKTSIHKQQAEHASVMRNLLGSLTQRAFSGELTAKDTEIIEAAE